MFLQHISTTKLSKSPKVTCSFFKVISVSLSSSESLSGSLLELCSPMLALELTAASIHFGMHSVCLFPWWCPITMPSLCLLLISLSRENVKMLGVIEWILQTDAVGPWLVQWIWLFKWVAAVSYANSWLLAPLLISLMLNVLLDIHCWVCHAAHRLLGNSQSCALGRPFKISLTKIYS